ncbi:FAD-binding oxidoreductase [Histidinibacterium aquaticum]|uniref:FAD-binding oxidoreductase n=1 Tax=Histidinibacterium aquaticum TaxID=2613962 RepID=A0A5J5GPL4_9RHOB|nr:FAD-binding oxidoreductase [Histidinibacterium aquaticum]KAA9009997.1 FAD-binding oxidoreductase [Histidinibacterium aquaticum]
MTMMSIKTLSGTPASLSEETVAAFGAGLRGGLSKPGDAGFEAARTVWNATIDRRPDLVVHAAGPADILAAVRFASEHRLLVAVRAGGHNIAGKAVADGGLLIDLSGMHGIRVDPAARRAWVEAGATLADVDAETQAHGLVVPVGINSTTGIAGLTLGGGFGWTTRAFGMTIDNLVSADVVTADGRLVRASAEENPDLFWALRGGGGNFGVVSAFEFELHPLGPEVTSGLIVHPFDDAGPVLRQWRDFVDTAPREVSAWAVLRKAPPLPFLPEEWHGREVVVLAACYAGPMEDGETALAPLRAIGSPIVDVIGPHPFAGWQQAFDPLLTPGARNYWKSHDFKELPDAAIDLLTDYAQRLPSPECEIFVASLGGAMSEVPEDATAYGGRGANFVMNVHTRWQSSEQDDDCIGWARAFFDETAPHAMPTIYVNFLPDDESGHLDAVYGPNYARLAEVKATWDPGNMFRVNQNIAPAEAAQAAE